MTYSGRKDTLDGHVAAIRRIGKQTITNIIEIGRRLSECKGLVGQRDFGIWLDNEFGWSERHARNFVYLFELSKSKSENFSELDLPVSALYLLAAPSTPEPVRDEVLSRAKGGEKMTVAEVKETIAEAAPPTSILRVPQARRRRRKGTRQQRAERHRYQRARAVGEEEQEGKVGRERRRSAARAGSERGALAVQSRHALR